MIEKVKRIGNPLTIIAVFAGLAEISGTVVLPLLEKESQLLYVHFLMFFPTALIVLFFLTLNFNHKVLYAPSDYNDEDNFVKTFDLNKNETKIVRSKPSVIEQIDIYQSKSTHDDITINISNLPEAKVLISSLSSIGLNANIYKPPTVIDNVNEYTNESIESAHRSIWVGREVNIDILKKVINEAHKHMPYLEFLHISGDLNDDAPMQVYRQVFIGGATSTARRYGLIPFSKDDFKALLEITKANEFHDFIRSHYSIKK